MLRDVEIKLAIYRHFAENGRRPAPAEVAYSVGAEIDEILAAYRRLQKNRVLVLEPDGESIRMAPPFSGVSTQHSVVVGERRYFANCAWDAFGIPAAMRAPAVVESRCEQTGERLQLEIDESGPEPSTWLFHTHVPAAHWWDDIVFT